MPDTSPPRQRSRRLAPERRSRGDVLAAAAIVAVVALVIGVIWYRSDARATVSEPAAVPAAPLRPTGPLAATLTQAWSLPSASTITPAVASGAVVTADASSVLGHDPVTGAELWRYSRDQPLCAVTAEWGNAVAVFRENDGCTQVIALGGADGRRGAERSSDIDGDDDGDLDLVGDGTYLAAGSASRLEVWRSDLVRTLELGQVDAPVNPSTQPRVGCTLESVAVGSARLAAVQRCPGEEFDRLSALSVNPADSEKPQESSSTLLGVTGARVVAVTGDRVAVYLPGEQSRVVTYDTSGAEVGTVPVAPATAGSGRSEPVTRTGTLSSWWTGSTTVALSPVDLSPLWTLHGTLGPGVSVGGQFAVPVPGGVAVLDEATGATLRTVPVDRGGYDPGADGPVRSAVAGDTLLEQRGSTLVGLRPAGG